MNVTEAPHVIVRNKSGLGLRVMEPAWLHRMKKIEEYRRILAAKDRVKQAEGSCK